MLMYGVKQYWIIIIWNAVELRRLSFACQTDLITNSVDRTFTFHENIVDTKFRACFHGGGGPQVSELTRLGRVTRLSI